MTVTGRRFDTHVDEADRPDASSAAPAASPPRTTGLPARPRAVAAGTALLALAVTGAAHLVVLARGLGGDLALVGRVLLALVVVVLAGGAGGRVARALRQPRVIGEMAAGFLLGPSLLGALAPEAQRLLFPPAVQPHLRDLAQLAVIGFVHRFGADLSLRHLRGSGRQVVAVAVGMVLIPVTAGVGFALRLAADHRPTGVGLAPFVVFVGVAMGVTAFPVLVRILQETGLAESRVGFVALTAAGLADAVAWCLLAVAVGGANGDGLAGPAVIVALLLAFAVATWSLLRPALRAFVGLTERRGLPDAPVAAALLLFALGGAVVTDRIGVHAIFGAFLVGLALPRHDAVVHRLLRPIDRLVRLVLPLFFAAVGLSIGLGFLRSADQLALLGLVVLVAVAGKLVGTATVARLVGMPWREAVGVGVMVNCRGLTELVVLTTGRSLGIIGDDLFAMLVLMTLLTTAVTGPLLGLLHLDREVDVSAPSPAAAATSPGWPASPSRPGAGRRAGREPSRSRGPGSRSRS